MTGLLRKWGLGVELDFNGDRAQARMTRTARAVVALKQGYEQLGKAAGGIAAGLGKIGMAMAPLGLGFGYLASQASSLAADLEGQQLTMRVLLGDNEKAAALMGKIRDYAAATPFAEGDLIEGSKRLLRLTGSNVDANMDLLKLVSTMSALNPGKSVVDATEAVLDATSGGGFERMKEFGITMRADDFKAAGQAGGKEWGDAIVASLQQRMTDVTHGVDIVGELSRTFSGRLSTLKDAASNVLREVGIAINAEVGPMLEGWTTGISSMVPVFKGAALELIGIVKGLVARAQPYLEVARSLWEAMGTKGQQSLVLVAMGVSGLVAALAPLAGVVGVIGLVGSGLVTVGGALLELAVPEALAVIAGIGLALGWLAGAAFVLFEVFKRDGEGPLGFLIRLGSAVQTFLIDRFEVAKTLVAAFAAGFGDSFGGVGAAIERIKPPILDLWDRLSKLFGFMQGGAGESADTWAFVGEVLGYVANVLVDKIAAGIELVVAVVDVLTTTFGPLILAVFKFMDGLIGLVTGSKSAGDAISQMIGAVVYMIVGLINGAFSLVLGAIEIVLRQVAMLITGLPGGKALLDATGGLGADALAGARQSFSDDVTAAIGRIGEASTAREGAKAASTNVTVNPGETTVQANVTTSVQVDSKEVARANGKAAVKAGQRQGRELPHHQAGRVLRGNGTVTPLRPYEILPTT